MTTYSDALVATSGTPACLVAGVLRGVASLAGTSLAVNAGLKTLIARPRPAAEQLPTGGWFRHPPRRHFRPGTAPPRPRS
ncbi:hypothetical protein [Nocardia sp. NPDC004123]